MNACVHGSKNLVVKHGHMASVQEYSNLQALTSVKAKDGVAHQHSIFHALYQNAFSALSPLLTYAVVNAQSKIP